jgi:uncharacterized protein Usg
MTDKAFTHMLKGFSLTLAEIVYYLPDHNKTLVQQYFWQDYDLAPKFPKLKAYCDWWDATLDGKIHKVIVVHRTLITPAEVKLAGSEFRLN